MVILIEFIILLCLTNITLRYFLSHFIKKYFLNLLEKRVLIIQECIIIEMEDNKQSKVQMIIRKCLFQNSQFREWKAQKLFNRFHSSHYDWWAFPINQLSSYGAKFKVDLHDKVHFMKNEQFIKALKSNAILVCLAWGYDLVKGEEIKIREKDQKWQNWPIRLYKMACSLEYFQQFDLHENAIKYGCLLLSKGYELRYKRDLSGYFIRCQNNISKSKEGIQVNKQERNQQKQRDSKQNPAKVQKNMQKRQIYSYSVGKQIPKTETSKIKKQQRRHL